MNRTLFSWGFVAAAAAAVVLAASLISLSSASAQGPAISVDSLSSHVGGVAKVDVSVLDAGPPGIGAWTIDLHFDPDVLTGVACTAQQGGGICNEDYGVGIARIVGTNIYGLEGDAVLASMGLACKKPGESALELTISVFVDATPGDPTDVDAKIVNGRATCSEQPQDPTATPPGAEPKVAGDANCDGDVTALDAVLVLQYTVGLIHSFPCEDNADYNHDGVVNALDAALILQKDAGLI